MLPFTEDRQAADGNIRLRPSCGTKRALVPKLEGVATVSNT